ncbi:MAG: hypothetical protein CL910_06540 [Deltaproteobacteria bacterium]|nr:hypothetical protein [Deltaproteobacteria bacterium]
MRVSDGRREALGDIESQVAAALSGAGAYAVLFAGAIGLLLTLYFPALQGEFVADDHPYILGNLQIHELDLETLAQLVNPWSELSANVANWAPIHMLLHALEWQAFGSAVFGYHVVQIVVHALGSVLLVALFRHWGLSALASLFGGLLFLVHPANVEAVAWMSQLKTTGALVFAVGALILQRERPLLALLCFALALLTKALAIFALPAAVTVLIVRSGTRREWIWIAGWIGFFLFYLAPQFAAFQRVGEAALPLHPDPLVAARTIPAIAARYVAMGLTSLGVSAFQDTPRALGWLDPWWLAGSIGIAAFGIRAVLSLVRKRDEAIYWAWLVTAWLPIAQFFPFNYVMADRYLYFPLPALIGLVLVAGGDAIHRLPASRRRGVSLGALALGVALLVGFAARLPARAGVWRSEATLTMDSVRHSPDGVPAQLQKARTAAAHGDRDGVVRALEKLHERGFRKFDAITANPVFQPYISDPGFQKALGAILRDSIQGLEAIAAPNQAELRGIAMGYLALGELDRAALYFERAIDYGGPLDGHLKRQLTELQQLRRQPRP